MATPTASVGRIPAFGSVNRRGNAIGAFLFVMLAMLMFFVTALVNPALLPGNWVPLIPLMEFYFFASFVAMFGILFSRQWLPVGTAAEFLRWTVFGAAAGWGVMTVLFFHGNTFTPLPASVSLEYLLYTAFFIAPVEEVLFRGALPPITGWFPASCIIFPIFHVPVYALEYGTDPVRLFSNLMWVAIMGFVLWVAYRWKGLGFSIGIHFAYDAFVYGALTPFVPAAIHLGITPV